MGVFISTARTFTRVPAYGRVYCVIGGVGLFSCAVQGRQFEYGEHLSLNRSLVKKPEAIMKKRTVTKKYRAEREPVAQTPSTVVPEIRLPQPFREINSRLPAYRFGTIVDVGGNVGQSSVTYAKAFPESQIFMFEPVPASFARAVQATSQYSNVVPLNFAVGDVDGDVPMETNGVSTGNKVNFNAVGVERLPSITLDSFMAKNALDRVSFLKVDVEGYELQVLHGALGMLAITDFVQLELGMSLRNDYHLPFSKGVEFMDAHGFVPFLVCKQMFERDFPMLNRSDTVFINLNITR